MSKNSKDAATSDTQNGSPRGFALVLACLFLLTIAWLLPHVPRARSSNSIRQGAILMVSMGCVSCHRAPGSELGNPGSDRRRVPSLQRWVEEGRESTRHEVEEWIRDGHPASLRENPVAWKAHLERRIHMPAYGGRLNSKELDALVDWVIVAGGHNKAPVGAERRGQETARRLCLPCHGAGGAGGAANPGSLVGYVPALWGVDFDDLVRDDDELREWIVSGGSSRIAAVPLVSSIWNRQAIRMPAFGGELTESELQDLLAYVRWLGDSDGGIGREEPGPVENDHDS